MPGGTKRTLKKDISRSGNCVPPGGLVLDISHAAPVCPYMIGICRSGNCVPPGGLVLDIPHAAPVCSCMIFVVAETVFRLVGWFWIFLMLPQCVLI